MQSVRVGVIAYGYPIETAPAVENLCLDLVERGYEVDLITDELLRDKSVKISNVRIISFRPKLMRNKYWQLLMKKRFGKIFLDIDRWLFARKLKGIINNYSKVFCIEFWSLDSVARTGYDLKHVIYLMLEGIACTRNFEIEYVKRLLLACAFCVIPSPERGLDIETYFNITLDFEYMPISMRPPSYDYLPQKRSHKKDDEIQLVYSGYFAEWACLREFVIAYQNILSKSKTKHRLCLHGHKIGTEKYYRDIVSKIHQGTGIEMDLAFYDSKSYSKFLSGFDIGIAFYQNYCNSTDWDNIIFSSGKISSYLWAGLAILTNVSHPNTQKPPFLYIESITQNTIYDAIKRYRKNAPTYQTAALEHANKYYNLHKHMDKIVARLDTIAENLGTGHADELKSKGVDIERNLFDEYYRRSRYNIFIDSIELLQKHNIQSVVDIATGNGHFVYLCMANGIDANGYDVVIPEDINRIFEQRFGRKCIFYGDINRLSEIDGLYDCTTQFHLTHIFSKQALKYLLILLSNISTYSLLHIGQGQLEFVKNLDFVDIIEFSEFLVNMNNVNRLHVILIKYNVKQEIDKNYKFIRLSQGEICLDALR